MRPLWGWVQPNFCHAQASRYESLRERAAQRDRWRWSIAEKKQLKAERDQLQAERDQLRRRMLTSESNWQKLGAKLRVCV